MKSTGVFNKFSLLALTATVSIVLVGRAYYTDLTRQNTQLESNLLVDQQTERRLTRRGYRYQRVDSSDPRWSKLVLSATTRKAQRGSYPKDTGLVTANYETALSSVKRLRARNNSR